MLHPSFPFFITQIFAIVTIIGYNDARILALDTIQAKFKTMLPLGTFISLGVGFGSQSGSRDILYLILPRMAMVLGLICLTSLITTRLLRKSNLWK